MRDAPKHETFIQLIRKSLILVNHDFFYTLSVFINHRIHICTCASLIINIHEHEVSQTVGLHRNPVCAYKVHLQCQCSTHRHAITPCVSPCHIHYYFIYGYVIGYTFRKSLKLIRITRKSSCFFSWHGRKRMIVFHICPKAIQWRRATVISAHARETIFAIIRTSTHITIR